MILRGIEFGPVLDASGVRGFFGEGYEHHIYTRPFGLSFGGSTFVSKTTTFDGRKGNMPTRGDGMIPEKMSKHIRWLGFGKLLIYDCIYVDLVEEIVLNAVGLTGPGAESLFQKRKWQKMIKPFFISFMSVAETAAGRAAELEKFVALFRKHISSFRAPVGLQINYSCPNTGINPDTLIHEVENGLDSASVLGIPLMPKFNVCMPLEIAEKISRHPSCDALCVSNTIPWGSYSYLINWSKLFGTKESPLKEFGGGGLSGKPLLSLVAYWVRVARQHGITKPINAGGGILAPCDVDVLYHARAASIFVGSAAILRPWRVKKIIQRAHFLFSKKNR